MGGKNQITRKGKKLTMIDISLLGTQFLEIDNINALLMILKISTSELVSLINPKYITFKVKKGRNQFRIINQPTNALLEYQRKISYYLNCVYLLNPSSYCYSYTPSVKSMTIENKIVNRNIIEASKIHTCKSVILKIDIENFFQSITLDMIKKLFSNEPFNFNSEIVEFLSHSLTYNKVLPIGSATSPILSNFVFKPIDEEIANIKGICNYTRYSDDLTFSFTSDSGNIAIIMSKIIEIIEKNGFKVNIKKTKVIKSYQRQEVNGIVVNEKININRKYYRNLRAILHSIKQEGISCASKKYIDKNKKAYYRSIRNFYQSKQDLYISDYIIEKIEHHNGSEWFTYRSVFAKIKHLGFIRGKQDAIYLALKDSYRQLTQLRGFRLDFFSPKPEINTEIVYITNATANSVVFYAYIFLSNLEFANEKINTLRSEYSTKNGKLDLDKLHKSFINQSVRFINLYSIMRTENNFERAIDDLIENGKINKVFKFDLDKINLIRQFNRKIFHDNYSCKYMRNDYIEKDFYRNTGVFSDDLIKKKHKGYMVEKEYLVKLGMRLCKKCNEF